MGEKSNKRHPVPSKYSVHVPIMSGIVVGTGAKFGFCADGKKKAGRWDHLTSLETSPHGGYTYGQQALA